MRSVAILALLAFAPLPLFSQSAPAYRDAAAEQLVLRARAAREELGRSISSYTAIIRLRSAASLRMPLRDRMLNRTESAARVRWNRDGEEIVQLLASRRENPDGVKIAVRGRGYYDTIFDPASDRVYFALATLGGDDQDDMWAAHPLAVGSEEFYEYASGDTLTMRLGDTTIRAAQLNIFPRIPSFRYFTATLWIEPSSGAVVQAAYRPARPLNIETDSTLFDDPEDSEGLRFIPGMLKPIEADLETIVVQYSLWDLKHWLPRVVRIDGYFRAGGIRVPFSEETMYEIESVTDDDAPVVLPVVDDLIAGWADGVSMRETSIARDSTDERPQLRVFAPQDTMLLVSSEFLPPPVWESSPDFISEREVEGLLGALEAAVPRTGIPEPVRLGFEWGLGGADLLRYNRVEGISVGGRLTADHRLSRASVTVRLGSADLSPNAELAIVHPAWGGTVAGSAYHQLKAVDNTYLGLGNSIGALLFANDSGEYYGATGVRLSFSPPATDRRWYVLTAFAERQRALERGTTWSVARLFGSDREPRPNMVAGAGEVFGSSMTLTPWWGRDFGAPTVGAEYFLEGVTGDFEFVRSSLTLRTTIPVGSSFRIGLESGAGSSWGELPSQSLWYLGSSRTLRGYDGSAAVGSSFLRGRAEVSRGSGAAGYAIFSDAGWAGDRDAFEADDLLISVGAGATVMNGLLRFDVARALRAPTGWRLEVYLDALL